MKGMLEMGVSAVGGCCGTTRSTSVCWQRCVRQNEKADRAENDTLITSYASVVEMGTDPVIIGERINPTGKKRLKEALRRGHGLCVQLALEQIDKGAQVLDVTSAYPVLMNRPFLKRR